jgi:hypothetical protein
VQVYTFKNVGVAKGKFDTFQLFIFKGLQLGKVSLATNEYREK